MNKTYTNTDFIRLIQVYKMYGQNLLRMEYSARVNVKILKIVLISTALVHIDENFHEYIFLIIKKCLVTYY